MPADPAPATDEPRTLRRRPIVKLLAVLVGIAVACGLLDVVQRLLLATGVLPTPSIWLFEESQESVVFDPITGFRLTEKPTRVLRITDGEIEFSSVMSGNNLGFPDSEEFLPQRPAGPEGARRFAVFGDSFSANMVTPTPWCEVAEDAAAAAGQPVDLLNFSLDGIGLASWHGILTRILEPDGYEIDGVVFAVFASDLRRRLIFWDHSSGPRPRMGRWPNWDADTYPKSLIEVEPYLDEQSGFIVSRDEFDAAVAGDWAAFRAPAFRHAVARRLRGSNLRPESEELRTGRERTTAEVAAALDRMGVRRRIVVHVPSRDKLIAGETRPARQAMQFAEAIGAELWNGCDAFEGLGADEVTAYWWPRDPHWSQEGAARFARWFTEQLIKPR